MEDNNKGPYEYEKPLRPKQSKRLGFVAGLGLFGVGTVLSSSAFGATLFPAAPDAAEQPETTDANFVPSPDSQVVAEPVDAESSAPEAGTQIRVPLAHIGKEKNKKSAVALPSLPTTDFANSSNATQAAGHSNGSSAGAGNVSSPTPSAGSGSGSSSGSHSGNVSSPTPSAGSGSGSGSGSNSGNVSSPTPGGGSSSSRGDDGDDREDEHEDRDHEDREGDDD